MSEENLPSADEMRARYADLMKDDAPAADESAAAEEAPPVEEPVADEPEPVVEEAPAEEPEPEPVAEEAAGDEALPSAEDMRARYAHLMNDEAPAEDTAAAAPAPSPAIEPLPALEPEPEPEDVNDPSDDLAAHLLDVRVRLWAELGRAKLPLAQAVSLGEGAIVDLDKEPEDGLDVLVNGNLFAKATLLLVDGEWAIRLEEIVATPAAVEQASSSGSGA